MDGKETDLVWSSRIILSCGSRADTDTGKWNGGAGGVAGRLQH